MGVSRRAQKEGLTIYVHTTDLVARAAWRRQAKKIGASREGKEAGKGW